MTGGTSKAALRQAIVAARRALPAAERAARSASIAQRVLHLAPFQNARCIALYSPIGAEVDTEPIGRGAAERGCLTAFPRTNPGARAMAFAICASTELVEGPLGTREPPASAPIAEPASLDLVLVPGVAFDLSCRRLGRGRGHYDATLACLPARTLRVGLAFELQLVAEVPLEPHDVPLDAVVTETRVVFRLPPNAAPGRS